MPFMTRFCLPHSTYSGSNIMAATKVHILPAEEFDHKDKTVVRERTHWHEGPWKQASWDHHGAHLGPTETRWAPCRPRELCYVGRAAMNTNICSPYIVDVDWIIRSCFLCLPVNVNVYIAAQRDFFAKKYDNLWKTISCVLKIPLGIALKVWRTVNMHWIPAYFMMIHHHLPRDLCI